MASIVNTPIAVIDGVKVMVSPDRPKMTLGLPRPGHDDFVTPEFRKEIDAWMLEFFGTHNLLKDGEAWMLGNHTCYMNPRTAARVSNHLYKGVTA